MNFKEKVRMWHPKLLLYGELALLLIDVNPRGGLICRSDYFGVGLFNGGLFQSLAFSSKVDRENDTILSIN